MWDVGWGHGTPRCSALARGQRWLLSAWGVGVLGSVAWAMAGDGGAWAWGMVAWLVCAHPLALGLELLCMAGVHGDDAAPRPTAAAMVRAWWMEWRRSLRVFAWQQPFRWRSWPDPTAARAGSRAVVLVHGFLCNRGFWLPWLRQLSARGVPYVTVNLEPVFGGIDAYVPQVAAAVARAQALTGGRPVWLVGHSMGGLAIRAWMAATPDAPRRVAHVVTIGSPHGGTWLARWSLTRNGRQMRLGSAWLQALVQAERALRPGDTYAGFTCWYGNCDNIVFPPATATLPGADNRLVPGVPHVALAFAPPVLADLLARLEAAAGPGADGAIRPGP
jgi:triacylglycerol lipase